MQRNDTLDAMFRKAGLDLGTLAELRQRPEVRKALDVLKRVRNWLVVERGTRLADADYDAAVRMRLDTTLLPKPFQLSALTGRDFQLESSWKRFIVRAGRPG